MIESVWVVVAVIIIVRIGAIAAAIGGIIGVRQDEGSNDSDGVAGDEISTAIVTHIDDVGGLRRRGRLNVERQQASTCGGQIGGGSHGENYGRGCASDALSHCESILLEGDRRTLVNSGWTSLIGAGGAIYGTRGRSKKV